MLEEGRSNALLMYAFSHQGFFDDLRCARELIFLHETSFLPHVFPDFQGLFDDLRCAPELISIHKLLFSRHVFPDFCACGTHGLPCGCSPRPRGTKAPKTTLCSFPALLLILLFEVLLFRFLMTQSPLTSLLSSFFRFFLPAAQSFFALRRLSPAPGAQIPSERSRCSPIS